MSQNNKKMEKHGLSEADLLLENGRFLHRKVFHLKRNPTASPYLLSYASEVYILPVHLFQIQNLL